MVHDGKFLCNPDVLENVDVQGLARLGNVSRWTILTVGRSDGRDQNAAVGETRPTADLGLESAEKNLVERRTVIPICRTVKTEDELIDVRVDQTNIRPSHGGRAAGCERC